MYRPADHHEEHGSPGKKILVMGPEIRYAHHRGIFFYQKSLLAAFKRLGFTVGLLTQTTIRRSLLELGDPAVLRREIVHELAYPKGLERRRARKAWMRGNHGRGALEVTAQIETCDPKWRFLTNVDYLYNVPLFFDLMDLMNARDVISRLTRYGKRLSGQLSQGAVDIDFVAAAGYDTVVTASPTAIRSRTGRVRIIQSLLDLIPLEYPFGPEELSPFILPLLAALRHADHVVAISKYTLSSLQRFLPEYAEKCTVIYPSNPIETLLKRPAQDSSAHHYWLETSKVKKGNYFLYVGALERRKNTELLVRAFSMLPHGFKLLLLGPVNQTYLEETGLAEALLSPNTDPKQIAYLGYASDEQKIALLHNAAALVFPSVLEGFGLPVLEAMSAGCPVITTRCGSLPEVGGDAVLYLEDPYDASELAGLMQRVVTDHALADELRQKGLARAQAFTVDAQARALSRWSSSVGLLAGDERRDAADVDAATADTAGSEAIWPPK